MALVCVGVGGGEREERGRECGGFLESGRVAVTRSFPSPLASSAISTQADLVKRLGCSDLNSSPSPQRTLALANRPFAPVPAVPPYNGHKLCLCLKTSFLYLRKPCLTKKPMILFPAVIPLSRAARDNDRGFSFAGVTRCDWINSL